MTTDQPIHGTLASQPIWKSPVFIFMCLVFVGVMALFVLSRYVPDTAYRAKCAKQMQSLGQAFLLYQQDYRRHNGPFPPDLQSVEATQQIGVEVFLCPATSDTCAKGSNLAEFLERVMNFGQCSVEDRDGKEAIPKRRHG